MEKGLTPEEELEQVKAELKELKDRIADVALELIEESKRPEYSPLLRRAFELNAAFLHTKILRIKI